MISTKEDLKNIIALEEKGYGRSCLIRRYLRELRICEYYKNCAGGGTTRLLFKLHNFYRNRLGLRLGFEIPLNVFGKGLHIFHTGNIIINETSSVGEYCNIIGSTCLGSKDGGNGPTIGNHCELGMNSVVIGNVKIGNNVYIGAGAVVTKSFEQNGVSLAGVPAKIVVSRKDSKKVD